MKDKTIENDILNSLESRMDRRLAFLDNDLAGLRTGRVSAKFLDPVRVELYGNKISISQVSTISCTQDGRTIIVQVWDKSAVKEVEKAILNANLGVNPSLEGQVIRICIPPLNQERRKELIKISAKYGENTKISIRNIRRNGMEDLKKMKKNKTITQDDLRKISERMQKITDNFINKIDIKLQNKEKEITQV